MQGKTRCDPQNTAQWHVKITPIFLHIMNKKQVFVLCATRKSVQRSMRGRLTSTSTRQPVPQNVLEKTVWVSCTTIIHTRQEEQLTNNRASCPLKLCDRWCFLIFLIQLKGQLQYPIFSIVSSYPWIILCSFGHSPAITRQKFQTTYKKVSGIHQQDPGDGFRICPVHCEIKCSTPPRRAYSRDFMPTRRKRSKGRQDLAPRTQLGDMCKPEKEKITPRKEIFSCIFQKTRRCSSSCPICYKEECELLNKRETKVHFYPKPSIPSHPLLQLQDEVNVLPYYLNCVGKAASIPKFNSISRFPWIILCSFGHSSAIAW